VFADARLSEAEQLLRRARDLAVVLAAELPEAVAYQQDLAGSLNELAEILCHSSPEDADRAYLEAARIQRRLVDRFPDVPDHRYRLAGTQFARYTNLYVAGAFETPATCRRALAELQAVLEQCPDKDAAGGSWIRAELLIDLGRHDEAEKLQEQALERRLKLHADSPTDMGIWVGLAFTYFARGRLLTLQDKRDDAEAAFLQAQRYLQRVLDAYPNALYRRYELAIVLGHLGWHYLREPGPKDHARKALPLVRQALGLAPDGGAFLAALEGLAYYRLGEWELAIATLQAARARAEDTAQPHEQWGKKADGAPMIVAAKRQEKTAEGLILLLLSLSYHHQGKTGTGADYYRQARRWQARHPIDPCHAAELKAIQAEATITLGPGE
jgi:tetratricopeptide (TPR) repeat protein